MYSISDTVLKAISWTLVHSIWQGFILAFLAGIVILKTKKATSVLRYNLLSTLFLAFIFFIGLTFKYEYNAENVEHVKSLNFSIAHFNTIWTFENGKISNNFSIVIIDFLNENANTIVLIWFIIFCIKCFSITNNLSYIYKIRNYRNQPVSDYWKEILANLSKKVNINKQFTLLESQLVNVPSVTGFFKPIILLPIGLLSQLPQDQIEAILLHELAHIKRKDYFVNIIQSFAETVFFYNPGLLWVSSLIKEERENCCDDIAVSVTKCKSKFVHALVSFQEYNIKNNELIMGFGAKKNHLLNRAKRIITDNSKSLNTAEKSILSIAFFAVLSMMLIFGNASLAESKEQSKNNLINKNLIVQTINTDKNTALENDTHSVTEKSVIDELDEKARIADEKAVIAESQYRKYDSINQENSRKNKSTRVYEKTSVTTTDNKEQITEKVTISSDKELGDTDEISDGVIQDLIKGKIISKKNKLSFLLSSTKLIVNGVVQPDSLHSKFKKKYLNLVQQKNAISNNISIVYNYEISNLIACN